MGPLGAPVQVAYAVRDLHEAARRWVDRTGAGPFFVLEHIPLTHVRHRGAPGAFDHSSAYGQWGSVMVELVQDHTPGPSPIKDVLGDREGLHHLAFFVDLIDDAAAWCDASGWPELLRAGTPGGQSFAFHDASPTLGHAIELYEPTERLTAFYARVSAAATGWDGRDPVRVMGR